MRVVRPSGGPNVLSQQSVKYIQRFTITVLRVAMIPHALQRFIKDGVTARYHKPPLSVRDFGWRLTYQANRPAALIPTEGEGTYWRVRLSAGLGGCWERRQ